LAPVHLRLGPIPVAGARDWLRYAREVVASVPDEPGGDGVWLPADAVAGFDIYLTAWEAACDEDPFVWDGEVDRAEVEYLFHAFFRLVTHLAEQAERTGTVRAPPSSDAFYRTLVTGLLDALDRQGDSTSEFSEHLRAFWPGLA
jgi:hypothetical protein